MNFKYNNNNNIIIIFKMNNNNILELLNTITTTIIENDSDDIKIFNNMEIIKNQIKIKPIPIKYYSNNLIRISTNQTCCKCDKIADYKLLNSTDLYCWIHSHSY